MSASVKRAAYVNGNFTEPEAIAKLGKQVHLLFDFSQFRKGTTGTVVDFHERSHSDFQVVIRWNSFNGSEPVYERFSKVKYNEIVAEG